MNFEEHKVKKQNRDTALLLIPITAVVAKLIMHLFLPDKYFYDSWRMLGMLNKDKGTVAWEGYKTTVEIHDYFNVFHFHKLLEFSIFYGIIMTIIIMIIVSRTKEMDKMQVIFTLMAVGILNIYVFTINKEMIQILYFFAIYIIIELPIRNNIIKLISCAGVFYLESIKFRAYYVIMAALTVGVYIIFIWLRKKRIRWIHITITVIACFIMVAIFFYASSFISPEDYSAALSARDGTTNTISDAGSAIKNPIEVNGSLGVFMYDYAINMVRMMVPIELIIKSPGYFPFFIYQMFILVYIFKVFKNLHILDKKMVVVLSCFIAYILGSVVFEPDFGSWARHEATTFPVLQLLVFYNSQKENKELSYETETIQ